MTDLNGGHHIIASPLVFVAHLLQLLGPSGVPNLLRLSNVHADPVDQLIELIELIARIELLRLALKRLGLGQGDLSQGVWPAEHECAWGEAEQRRRDPMCTDHEHDAPHTTEALRPPATTAPSHGREKMTIPTQIPPTALATPRIEERARTSGASYSDRSWSSLSVCATTG